jgi:hypothetical protein
MTDNIVGPNNLAIYQIHDLYFKGKYNTELLLVVVPIMLFVLILFGTIIKQKKKAITVFLPLIFLSQTHAVCPVCTVAVGAGLGFARVLGIDDLITSVWMGGLIISSTIWLINWLGKRKLASRKVTLISYFVMYALVFIPLWISGTIGAKYNLIFGVDKVFLGIIAGSILFYLGVILNDFLKTKNANKTYFAFQKVVLPILGLWFGSLISYLIIYYYL